MYAGERDRGLDDVNCDVCVQKKKGRNRDGHPRNERSDSELRKQEREKKSQRKALTYICIYIMW